MTATDLERFDFRGQQVKVILIDGAPWFVAVDVCAVLGYTHTASALRTLRESERGVHRAHTPGGVQQVSVISEPGLYRLVMRSNRPQAEAFQDWVTGEVLPAIRRTGSYGHAIPELSRRELAEYWARAEAELEAANAKVAELGPAAEAWDHLVDTGTTLDVGAAAKKLREDGIPMGRTRLYAYLRTIGWVFAYGTQPKQSAVDAGWLTVDWGKPYVNERTGETEQGDAKTRVTAKGLAELRKRLAARAGEAS